MTSLSQAASVAYPAPMPETEDSALMLRYAEDNDVSAFESLYQRHKDPVFRYLLRQCRSQAAAEDVFQEVWGKIIKARSNYRPTAKFTTFLYRVAHNCFIDYLRRNQRHQGGVSIDDDGHASPGESPEMQTERILARERLIKALDTLPDEQKDTFLLHEEGGLALDEIANVTGVNRETAKSRLRYAMNKLRAAVNDTAETT